MSMSRKNYEGIANAINLAMDAPNSEEFQCILFMELDRYFLSDNPNYNSDTFAKACGI